MRRAGVEFSKPLTGDPAFHRAKLRLFAPALFGPSPSGFLGLLARTPIIGRGAYMLSSASRAYLEMADKNFVYSVKQDTEQLAKSDLLNTLLTAIVLWGEDEEIVAPGVYLTDRSLPAEPGHTHTSICKPKPTFVKPLEFVSG